jgi:hypothetical protein
MFTQSSQLRLSQRQPDAGKWLVPDILLEESSAATPGIWTDASAFFETAGCSMSSVGGVVDFRYAAIRTNVSLGNIYRLSFPNREDTISVPQHVGTLTVVKTVIAGDETDRTWAPYPLIGLPSGILETTDTFDRPWQASTVGDVVLFNGTWFI